MTEQEKEKRDGKQNRSERTKQKRGEKEEWRYYVTEWKRERERERGKRREMGAE